MAAAPTSNLITSFFRAPSNVTSASKSGDCNGGKRAGTSGGDGAKEAVEEEECPSTSSVALIGRTDSKSDCVDVEMSAVIPRIDHTCTPHLVEESHYEGMYQNGRGTSQSASCREEVSEEEEDDILNMALVASQSESVQSTSQCVSASDLESAPGPSSRCDSASELELAPLSSSRYDSASEPPLVLTANPSDSSSSSEGESEGNFPKRLQSSLVVNLGSLLSPRLCVEAKPDSGRAGASIEVRDHLGRRRKRKGRGRGERKLRGSTTCGDLRTLLSRKSHSAELIRTDSGNETQALPGYVEHKCVSIADMSQVSSDDLSSVDESEIEASVVILPPSSLPSSLSPPPSPPLPPSPHFPPSPPPPSSEHQPLQSSSEPETASFKVKRSSSLSQAWANVFRKPSSVPSTNTVTTDTDCVSAADACDTDLTNGDSSTVNPHHISACDETTTSQANSQGAVDGDTSASNKPTEGQDVTSPLKPKKCHQRGPTPSCSPRHRRSPAHSPARVSSPRRNRSNSLSPRKKRSPRKRSLAFSTLQTSTSITDTAITDNQPLGKVSAVSGEYDHAPYSGLAHVRQLKTDGGNRGRLANESTPLPGVTAILRRHHGCREVAVPIAVPPEGLERLQLADGLGLVESEGERGEDVLPRPKVG